MGEPARGQTPFKALTRHSQLLAEHPTRQTREAAGLESHEARAAHGTHLILRTGGPCVLAGPTWTRRSGEPGSWRRFPRRRVQVRLQVHAAL